MIGLVLVTHGRLAVEFRGEKASTEAKDGKWKVLLPMSKAGGPFELKVNGSNEITLTNVLVGEVWICSGQSNMEWPLRSSFEPEKDIANSKNSKIRLFTVPKLKSDAAVEDVRDRARLVGAEVGWNARRIMRQPWPVLGVRVQGAPHSRSRRPARESRIGRGERQERRDGAAATP